MKLKNTFLAMATVATVASGADHNLYPNSYYLFVNYDNNSKESNLDNSYSYDIRYNQNDIQFSNFSIDTLQYAMEITPSASYSNSDTKTSIFKGGINILWYLDNPSPFSMYMLGGVGLKYVNKQEDPQSMIGAYTNLAAGLEYNIRNDISLVAEKKITFEGSSKKTNSTSLGFRYSF